MPHPSADSDLIQVSLHYVWASHVGYILMVHMNERTLLNNVMMGELLVVCIESISMNSL